MVGSSLLENKKNPSVLVSWLLVCCSFVGFLFCFVDFVAVSYSSFVSHAHADDLVALCDVDAVSLVAIFVDVED